MLTPWKKSYDQPAAAAAKLLQSCLTLCDPIDGSPIAPLSLEFSRQEYWSGLPLRSPMTNLDNILKSRDITNKGLSSQGYGFPSSHVWM